MSNSIEKQDVQALIEHFNVIRPFNKVLGLSADSMDIENACVYFNMREELLGNSVYGTLHGGVISAILDITGGFVVFLDLFKTSKGTSREKLMERLTKVATIDMRVDYLRPGIGEEFTASGYILRTGSKVAVVRMELHNEENALIAVGTASYIVG
ncbi:MAG: thioesterase family protein [Chloroflexi bacterium]|nr:thioesterase family protein [Chloroflexota bacterium]